MLCEARIGVFSAHSEQQTVVERRLHPSDGRLGPSLADKRGRAWTWVNVVGLGEVHAGPPDGDPYPWLAAGKQELRFRGKTWADS